MDKVYLLVECRDYYLDDYENDYYETTLGVFDSEEKAREAKRKYLSVFPIDPDDPATLTYDIREYSINELSKRVMPVGWQADESKEGV